MGTRYIVSVKCSDCGAQEEAYYAPTCDFTTHECVCGHVIDLAEYTGISYECASNAAEIEGLVDSIWNQYKPDCVSPPGETLLETLETIGMTQVELAECVGVLPEKISGIVEGIVPITPGMASSFECALGVPAGFWINREQNYRQYLEGSMKKADEWTEVWPTEPGRYWFYGWCSPSIRRDYDPDMILVQVMKMMNNAIGRVGNGRFIYEDEGAHGLWKKAVLPEPPELESCSG